MYEPGRKGIRSSRMNLIVEHSAQLSTDINNNRTPLPPIPLESYHYGNPSANFSSSYIVIIVCYH